MPPIKMPPVVFDPVVFQGGLDLVTPTLSLKNGFVRDAQNFECSVTGGYTRIEGYERFDGRTSPSSTSIGYQVISVTAMTNTPSVGATVTGATSTATGVVAAIDGLRLVLTKLSSPAIFEVGENITITGPLTVGTIDDIGAGPVDGREDAIFGAATSDIYRADIQAVPGTGPVRGVILLNGVVYALRNDANGTAKDIYKQTNSGWSKVTLFKTISFTAGASTLAVFEGATLTQGGVTATVKRACVESGTWAGSNAAGTLIITTPAGGNFTAGAATMASTTLTLSGAEAAMTIAPGGKVEYDIHNFFGATSDQRAYCVDGVGKAFEFDGTVYAPITISSTITTFPKHVAQHVESLFLSIGAKVYFSQPGNPFGFSTALGGGSFGTGDDVTGMVQMPGTQTNATMAVTQRSDTRILYGTASDDFQLSMFNSGTGASEYTLQNMAQTLAYEDRGATSLQAALTYGNFISATLTSSIIPFIEQERGSAACASLSRRKSQYRVFFTDKRGLYITIVNGKLLGCMPVKFEEDVYVITEGKNSGGEDVSFFGSSDGFVYQLDKGPSFDGANIEAYFMMNYTSARNSRIKKRFRRASLEVMGQSYIEMYFGYSLGYDSNEVAQPAYGAANLNGTFYESKWDGMTWDTFYWDAKALGPLECQMAGTAENVAIIIASEANFIKSFSLNSAIIHYSTRRVIR